MTIPQIILRAKISQYLATNDIYKAGLFGGGTPAYLPSLLYQVRKDVERMYGLEPDEENLVGNANYLYALCGKYGLYASGLIASGGSIPSPSSTTVFGYPQSSIYTASSDGETFLTLLTATGQALPTGSLVIWVMKASTPLNPITEWTYTYPILTLLAGHSMGVDETLAFQYVSPL